MEEIIARAKQNKQRIVLPEGTEERTLKAADRVLADGVADLIIIGNKQEIEGLASQWGLKNISKATIIDPENNTWVASSSRTAMPTVSWQAHATPQAMFCVPLSR